MIAAEQASVEDASMIGIDLAKHVFQQHGTAADGTVLFYAHIMIPVDVRPEQRAIPAN